MSTMFPSAARDGDGNPVAYRIASLTGSDALVGFVVSMPRTVDPCLYARVLFAQWRLEIDPSNNSSLRFHCLQIAAFGNSLECVSLRAFMN